VNIETIREELNRLEADRAHAYQRYQDALRKWAFLSERLKREQIRAELLDEKARAKEQA
jgi:hypothetical protein